MTQDISGNDDSLLLRDEGRTKLFLFRLPKDVSFNL